jgi:hypothetical protein
MSFFRKIFGSKSGGDKQKYVFSEKNDPNTELERFVEAVKSGVTHFDTSTEAQRQVAREADTGASLDSGAKPCGQYYAFPLSDYISGPPPATGPA